MGDSKSLAILDGSSNRVDLCYHWIQQMVVDGQASGTIAAPPPIVGRVLGELCAGMSKFGNAKKHAIEQFPLPYAQATAWLLILYSTMLPMMMVQWSDWISGAFVFTFLQLFFIWALHSITIILERPFDTSNANHIDVFSLQRHMNEALLLLLNPETVAGPPMLQKHVSKADSDARAERSNRWPKQYNDLHKRDTVHKAALKKEGWHIKDESLSQSRLDYSDEISERSASRSSISCS